MIHFSNDKFKELMKIPENKKCFDCDNISCQWASINNGIFLCTKCSGVHRGFGVEKSYIRSIVWDNWTDKQVEYMRNGGNKQLKELLKLYSFDIKSIPTEKFYQTKIMEFYRKFLKYKVEGKEFNESPPSKEEAFNESLINLNTSNEDKFKSVGSSIQNDDENDIQNVSFQDSIKNWMGQTYQETKDTFNKLELGNKLSYAKNTIIDTGSKIIENAQIKNMIKKTNETFSYYFNYFMGNSNNNDDKKSQEKKVNIKDDNIYNRNIYENEINKEESKENFKNDINLNYSKDN